MGQGSDSQVRGFRARESVAVRGRGKKRAAWQPHAWHSSQPVTPPPAISALSPAPSVTSVVTPVILTLPQEAGYPRSAYSLPKAKTGGKGCVGGNSLVQQGSVMEWYLPVL